MEADVLLASAFMNGEDYVERYFAQVAELRKHLPLSLRLIEGDSTDDTYGALEQNLLPGDELFKIEHGGQAFGSIDHPARWGQIAFVWNTFFEKLTPSGPLILVEADLVWQPETLLTLAGDLSEVDAVAPLSLKDGGFYDTWGHRGLDGARFYRAAPFHPSLNGLTEIGSAGSCIAMREDVYRECRFGVTDGIVGFGADIRAKGFRLFCDPSVAVVHP